MTPAPARQPVLVGCILTKNEAHHVLAAIRSMAQVVDEVVVVDSESTDDTAALARGAGAVVLVHRFDGYSRQRNWALDQITKRYGRSWVLTVDADEWLSVGLQQEIQALRPRLGSDADVYLVRRRTRFSGRVLRHGGFGTTWLARLAPSDYARYDDRGINEHLVIPHHARVTRLTNWLEHADVDSWERYIEKHNRYSSLEARARIAAEGSSSPATSFGEALRDPTRRRQLLRRRVFDRVPARPALRFVLTYLVFGGFLDGRAGFERAVFETWQELCIDLKARQMRGSEE